MLTRWKKQKIPGMILQEKKGDEDILTWIIYTQNLVSKEDHRSVSKIARRKTWLTNKQVEDSPCSSPTKISFQTVNQQPSNSLEQKKQLWNHPSGGSHVSIPLVTDSDTSSSLQTTESSEKSERSSISSTSSTSSTSTAMSQISSSPESTLAIMRGNLLEQIKYCESTAKRMLNEKSPQDVLIEYLHKKMEQEAEVNRILIESTERMVKFQGEAQVESAKVLKKCAGFLKMVSKSQNKNDKGVNGSNDEESSKEIP